MARNGQPKDPSGRAVRLVPESGISLRPARRRAGLLLLLLLASWLSRLLIF